MLAQWSAQFSPLTLLRVSASMPVATLGAVAVAAAVASGAPVPVAVSLGLSIVGYKLTSSFLSSSFVREAFIKARLVGVDLNKPTTKRDAAGNLVRPVDGALVPEAAGVLAGTVYLVCMFVFIPVRFLAQPWPQPNANASQRQRQR